MTAPAARPIIPIDPPRLRRWASMLRDSTIRDKRLSAAVALLDVAANDPDPQKRRADVVAAADALAGRTVPRVGKDLRDTMLRALAENPPEPTPDDLRSRFAAASAENRRSRRRRD